MSTRFVNIDRDTPMLLPSDLREWVQHDDLVHFVVDALELLDVSSASVNRRGTGSEQYPPGMMLGLLIYGYAQGLFSSRQLERATYQNLSVRYPLLAGS
jgi:transposase